MGFQEALLVTAAAGIGGTGLGGLMASLFRQGSRRQSGLFLSFAGGVMLSVSCFGLLTEAAAPGALGLTALGLCLGCGVTAVLGAILDRGRSGLTLAGLVMAAAIALHNIPEGMVIGASFVGGAVGRGWAMAAVIGLHNVPEGMAVSAPLAADGAGRFRSAGLAALSGAPTVLGAALGYRLGELGPSALAMTLSFAAGAMLYVVFGELLPESWELGGGKLSAMAAVLGVLVGMLIA